MGIKKYIIVIKIWLLMISLVSGCVKSKKSKELCAAPIVSYHFSYKGNEKDIYYLLVKNYEKDCFQHYDFMDLAQKYVNTLKTNNLIDEVTFCWSDKDYNNLFDYRDWDLVENHSIISLYFDTKQQNLQKLKLEDLTYWENGLAIEYSNYPEHEKFKSFRNLIKD